MRCAYSGSHTAPSSTSGAVASGHSRHSGVDVSLLSARSWHAGGTPVIARASRGRARQRHPHLRSAPGPLRLRPAPDLAGTRRAVGRARPPRGAVRPRDRRDPAAARPPPPRPPCAGRALHGAEPPQALPGAVPLARAVGAPRGIRHLGLQRRGGPHRRGQGVRRSRAGDPARRRRAAIQPGGCPRTLASCERGRRAIRAIADRRRASSVVSCPRRACSCCSTPLRTTRACDSGSAARGRSRPSSTRVPRQRASPTGSSSSAPVDPERRGRLLPHARRARRAVAADRRRGPSSSAASPSRRWRAACRSSRATRARCPTSSAAPDIVVPAGDAGALADALVEAGGPRAAELRASGLARAAAVHVDRRRPRLPRALPIGHARGIRPRCRARRRGRRRRLRRTRAAAAGARARVRRCRSPSSTTRRCPRSPRSAPSSACATSTPGATAASRRA